MKKKIVNLQVCVTCRGIDKKVVGAEFHSRLEDALSKCNFEAEIHLHQVECFAICNRPCTVAVSSDDKWTYIIGDLDVKTDIQALLDYLMVYAASDSGTPSLKDRPAAIRKGTIARLPPHLNKGNQ